MAKKAEIHVYDGTGRHRVTSIGGNARVKNRRKPARKQRYRGQGK